MIAAETPNIGSLYHKMAVLTQPGLEKLWLFKRSLACSDPFHHSQEDLKEIYHTAISSQSESLKVVFTKVHGSIFLKSLATFEKGFNLIRGGLLDRYIVQTGKDFKVDGTFIAAINVATLVYERKLDEGGNNLESSYSFIDVDIEPFLASRLTFSVLLN